jgi:tetratricopeptide (TPR) repeat protein
MRRASLCPEAARVVTGLLAVLLLLPWGARAQVSPEVRTYLTSVGSLYESLEYERALEQISSARRLTRGAEDDVALSLYEGLILADMGRNDAASAAFKAALFLNPEAQLPVQVSPKVARQFKSLRKQVKQVLASGRTEDEPEPRRPEPPPPPSMERARLEAPAPVAPPAEQTQAEHAPTVNTSGQRGLRSRALIPAVAGGVLLAVGGVSYGLARNEQARLRNGDPSLTSYEEARRSMSRGKSFQNVGVGLIGAGVVGLGLAAGFYVLGAPEAPMALSVGTDGTSAFVTGRWP